MTIEQSEAQPELRQGEARAHRGERHGSADGPGKWRLQPHSACGGAKEAAHAELHEPVGMAVARTLGVAGKPVRSCPSVRSFRNRSSLHTVCGYKGAVGG